MTANREPLNTQLCQNRKKNINDKLDYNWNLAYVICCGVRVFLFIDQPDRLNQKKKKMRFRYCQPDTVTRK